MSTQNASPLNTLKILVVDDDDDIRELLAFNITSEFSTTPLEAQNGKVAIELLNAHPDVQIVVCDYSMPVKNGGAVYQHIVQSGHAAKFILCSTNTPAQCPEIGAQSNIPHVEKPYLNNLDNEIRKLIPTSVEAVPTKENNLKNSQFVAIRLTMLRRLNQIRADVYIKLADDHFVKVIHSGEIFGEEELSRFLTKDLTHLYILRDQAGPCIELQIQDMAALLTAKEKPNLLPLPTSAFILQTLHSLLDELGATPELQDLAKKHAELASKTVMDIPEIKSILGRVYALEDDYLINHSLIIGNIACVFAKILEWGSEVTLFKLSLAAQLHDITLNSARIGQIKQIDTNTVKSNDSLSAMEKAFQFSHPEQAAQLCRSFTNLPPDIDTIILQHHERPDGTGFPGKLTHEQITPLSAVFIAAHDYYEWVILQKKDPHSFIDHFKSTYSHGTFKTLIQKLSKFI